MEIVLATTNLHKIREFKEMFKPLKFIDLLTLLNFPDYTPPEETESTFEGNAALKAAHAARTIQKWVIADDSGLVVPALNGEPGVLSRRYAGENASDKDNRAKLLAQMEKLPSYQRGAYFQCSLALANEDGVYKIVSGIVEGEIVPEERGREGFGYDALFQPPDSMKTYGELPEAIKNKISHRCRAVKKLISTLESLRSR